MTTYRELDGRLTPEQQALKQQMHEFAKSVVRPTATCWIACRIPSRSWISILLFGRCSEPPMPKAFTQP